MNNKLILLPIIPLLFFSSCSSSHKENKSADYKKHLQALAEGPYSTYNLSNYDYDLSWNKTKTSDGESFVYTVLLSYKSKDINNIKAIMLPYDCVATYTSSNLASIGYSKVMNLTSIHEKNTNNYSQFKLQMEKKNEQKSVYLSVSYANNQDLFELKF